MFNTRSWGDGAVEQVRSAEKHWENSVSNRDADPRPEQDMAEGIGGRYIKYT